MEVIYTDEFLEDVKKLRDKALQTRVKKLIQKIIDSPDVGKPLMYGLKGLRSARVPPFRLIYELRANTLILHKFEHRKGVYE